MMPHQKIICGTCRGDGREVSFTGAEFVCQSCGGVGSHYEAIEERGGEESALRLENDLLKKECDRLMKANKSLQNQFDHAEKIYLANSRSYRDEIAELSASLRTKGNAG